MRMMEISVLFMKLLKDSSMSLTGVSAGGGERGGGGRGGGRGEEGEGGRYACTCRQVKEL